MAEEKKILLLGAREFWPEIVIAEATRAPKIFLSDFEKKFSRVKISGQMMMICGEVNIFCTFRAEKPAFEKSSKTAIFGLKIFKLPPRAHFSSK